FEGSMMPELFLADALGATGKPLLRVHTAGSVGGSTGIVATNHVQGGVHGKVLAVAWEKQSESNAMWALSNPVPFTKPVGARAGEASGRKVAWVHGTAMRTEPLAYTGRDQVSPQAGKDASAALWRQAGITNPLEEIDAAEIYVPFSWFEPMWLENLGFMPEG